MRRLKGLHIAIKNRSSLDAMKLYMLLLAMRERYSNVARVSYAAVREYTGMRKEEISVAVQLLQGAQLVRLARDKEVPLKEASIDITATLSPDCMAEPNRVGPPMLISCRALTSCMLV